MALDITEQKAMAGEAYRKLQVKITMLGQVRGITEDVKRTLAERYRKQFDEEIDRFQRTAREKLEAERSAVAQRESQAGQMRIEQLRKTLGDQLVAQSIQTRIASLDASELINVYKRSASDFERAVIAAFGPGMLYQRGEMGRAIELERHTSSPDERNEQTTLAQLHDDLDRAQREIQRLSPFAERRELASRFGLGDDRAQIALPIEEISQSEANLAKAGISHDLLTLDMAAV